MKKTLAAVAVLGAFAGSALAADVTLYGRVDRKISVRFLVYLPVEASNRLKFWKKFLDFCLLFLSS